MATPQEKLTLYESLFFALTDGNLTVDEANDLIAQYDYYNANQDAIDAAHPGKFIAIANLNVYEGNTLDEAINAAKAGEPGRRSYALAVPPAVIAV